MNFHKLILKKEKEISSLWIFVPSKVHTDYLHCYIIMLEGFSGNSEANPLQQIPAVLYLPAVFHPQ